jgi:hypothetical protein
MTLVDQLIPGVAASLIAAVLVAFAGVALRVPALRRLRAMREAPRLLDQERRRVAQLEETLRNVRTVLLGLQATNVVECDLARVRRDVNTRYQWRNEAPQITRVENAVKALRIDRGAADGVVEGMKLRVWNKAGDLSEEYVLLAHDIDQRCTHVRLQNASFLQLSEDQLGASFVTPTSLTPLEETLATLLAIIESSIHV